MNSQPFAPPSCGRIVNAVLAAVLSAFFIPHAQATSLLANGNFEQLKQPGVSSQFGLYYASQEVNSWSTSGYNFVFTPGTADTTGAAGEYGQIYLWGPQNGASNGLTTSPLGGNFLGFDSGSHQGAVTQTIKGLIVGNDYSVSFYWAAAQQHGYNGTTSDHFTVSLGAQSDITSTVSIPSHGFSGWQYDSVVFKATSSSEVLSFLASGTPSGVPPFALLDGVSMAQIPEPASWALLVLGIFIAAGTFAYSRRRSVR